MVDDLTPQDPSAVPVEGAVAVEEKQGFFSTTNGKIVLIGGAIVAFLIVAGLVTFAVMMFVSVDTATDMVEDMAQDMQSQTTTDTAESGKPSSPAVEPGDVPLSSIFTFRDIFDPLIKPEPTSEGTSTDGSSDDPENIEGMAPDTLYLHDIIVEDGVSKAVLWYNNVSYSLAEGEVLSDTPWQVLSIYSGSVTMLYGDTQVTLVVGQGISSK